MLAVKGAADPVAAPPPKAAVAFRLIYEAGLAGFLASAAGFPLAAAVTAGAGFPLASMLPTLWLSGRAVLPSAPRPPVKLELWGKASLGL